MLLRQGTILGAIAAFGGGLTLAVVPSLGATHEVTAGSSNVFTPETVTIPAGDSVGWKNSGGFHNVRFDDDSFRQPSVPEDTAWRVSRPFDTPGTFRYYCEAHGGKGGGGMSGTVVVTSGSTTSPTGPTQPGGPVGGSADTVAPKLTLGGATAQRVARRRFLRVAVSVNERADVTARARVSLPGASRVFSFRKASRTVAAGTRATLELRLSARGRRALAAALARGRRPKATVAVVAKDAAGNSTTGKRRFRLR